MPYGLKNEKTEDVKWVEDCINSITGTNKRTGKPYTEGEKIAICKAKRSKMKEKGSSELTEEEELTTLSEEAIHIPKMPKKRNVYDRGRIRMTHGPKTI